MILEEITMPEFEAGLSLTRTVIIPVGSVEEHGPHLPLSTDAFHVYEVAKAASREVPVFVALPLYYGVCRSTSQHPGTVGISGDTLRRLIREIAQSLYAHGLKNFIILSGHAGGTHTAALIEAGEEILAQCPDAKAAALNILELAGLAWRPLVETRDDSHAGEVETSVIQFLRPQWVKGEAREEYPSFPKPLLVRDKRKYWPGGVWGNPRAANPQKGERLFRAAVDELTALIRKIEAFKE
jgi:creatinine amidohydrolase